MFIRSHIHLGVSPCSGGHSGPTVPRLSPNLRQHRAPRPGSAACPDPASWGLRPHQTASCRLDVLCAPGGPPAPPPPAASPALWSPCAHPQHGPAHSHPTGPSRTVGATARWHYALASCVTGTPQRPQLCSEPAPPTASSPARRRGVHKRHADGSQPASCSHAGTRTSTCCTCTRAAHAPSDSPPCRPAPAQLLAPTSDTSAPPPQTCRQLRGDAPCLHDPNPAPLQDPGAWPLGKGLIVCLCF